MKRDVQILIRASGPEKEGFELAAELAGIGLSAWARERLRIAAIHELQQAGVRVPFVRPIPIRTEGPHGTED